jgi:thiamine biosynthesis lipoprotein
VWTSHFSALGTEWQLSLDVAEFDQQFSRFIADSEVNAWRHASAGVYQISPQLAEILEFAQKLKVLTRGKFDPAIGTLLEAAGYDPEYSFRPNETQLRTWQLPEWRISGRELQISGPVVFDIGGFGKGYWIDQLSQFLTSQGFPYHLVDGGGDMFATTKKDGQGWRVAIEWPGKPDTAVGEVTLFNQGLAVSDVLRRKWGEWHHVVDPETTQPVVDILSAAAVASTATLADAVTSVVCLTQPSIYKPAVQELGGEYLVINTLNEVHISPGWPGTFY